VLITPVPDAPLTALGQKQSAALAPQIPDLQQEVDLIVTSALTRTLQSTKLGWAPAIERLGIENVICLPQAQECNAFPCDTGNLREELEALDEFKGFNFELLTPDWTSKKGFYAPHRKAHRAKWVRQYLRERPEANIVLVCHGDMLRQITATSKGESTKHWKNAEVGVYYFDPETVETENCFLYRKETVAEGYDAMSTEMDISRSYL
jgi:broad specificity phosphatase PhoE